MRTTSKLSTTTDDQLAPVHPGEVLEQEFLIPMGLSAYRVAVDIGVAPPRINDILLRRRAITADTALRLARYFGTSERFWLGLQAAYDLDVERDRIADDLERVPRFDRAEAPSVRRPRMPDVEFIEVTSKHAAGRLVRTRTESRKTMVAAKKPNAMRGLTLPANRRAAIARKK